MRRADNETREPVLPLEPSRRTHLVMLILTMVFPTIAAAVYFIVLGNVEAARDGLNPIQVGYTAAKLLQLAFPLAWVVCIQRQRLSWRRFSGRGILPGLAFGAAAALTGLAVYHGLLADSELIRHAPDLIGKKVRSMGLGTPTRYLVFSVFLAFPHALFEEYYWRWFAFGQLSRVTRPTTAIVVSSLAFMSHHVIILHTFFHEPLWLIAILSLAVAVGGGFWAWLYHRSQSLLGPWFSHVLIDAGIMLIGYQLIDW